MLNFDAQQRAREALRRADEALVAQLALESEVTKQATSFRDTLFSAFQFVESEALALQELSVQLKRSDKNQLQVGSQGRPSFVLVLDTELAYDHNQQIASQGQAPAAENMPELAARIFAVLLPPNQGLLRHYTIFASGAWKRTTFTLASGGVQARSALVPRASPDVLVLEAIDLLGYAALVRPLWSPLVADAESFTPDLLRDRTRTRLHQSGLGGPRR